MALRIAIARAGREDWLFSFSDAGVPPAPLAQQLAVSFLFYSIEFFDPIRQETLAPAH
jgi:hypothetical protein